MNCLILSLIGKQFPFTHLRTECASFRKHKYLQWAKAQVSNPSFRASLIPGIGFAYHCEAYVRPFQRRSVVCSVSGYGDHFAVTIHSTLDDAFDQIVLVLRRRSSQDAQLRPDLVNQFLFYLYHRWRTTAVYACSTSVYYAMAPPPISGALSDAFVWRLSDVCLSVCRVHRA